MKISTSIIKNILLTTSSMLIFAGVIITLDYEILGAHLAIGLSFACFASSVVLYIYATKLQIFHSPLPSILMPSDLSLVSSTQEMEFNQNRFDKLTKRNEVVKTQNISSNKLKSLQQQAHAKQSTGDYLGAINDYSQLIDLHPKYAQYYLERRQLHYRLKNYSDVF